MATTLVPDTSVLIDGRITELLEGDYQGANVLVPLAALAELEAQANRGLETGFAGLDELSRVQQSAREGACSVSYVGERPTAEEIERASAGAIDARIRDAAVENNAVFVTSDRVQAHAADAQGLEHIYLRPVVDVPDLTQLAIWSYFDEETMSVHLKADCDPMVKKGTPAGVTYQRHGADATPHVELRRIIKECIEFSKRDYSSFIEMERHGCTVLQMGPMRVTVAQPPFSDALEVTAVRPVFKATLDDYDLPDEIRERLAGKARGILVAGPPGSGKSTFAAAVAEHLHEMNRVVKTMEQPRDLQVPKEITQYGALDRDMQWTGEVLLLVRPDHVIYDEVRTSNDFRVYADMRLAGIGLFGVTHANRPIDAVQRMIGRVDLGMIPQIVDTVVFIDGGAVATILEMRFTVKVPEGMVEADLARPVVLVKDLMAGRDIFELYTYGEQIVVMPIGDGGPGGAGAGRASPAGQLAERELVRSLRRYVRGRFDVEVRGDKATIFVDAGEVPALIGKGGKTVQGLERRLGIRLDVRAHSERPPGAGRDARRDDDRAPPPGRGGPGARAPSKQQGVRMRTTGSNLLLYVDEALAGQKLRVDIEGARVGEATASQDGRLRFKASSPEAQALMDASKRGLRINVRRG